MEHIERFIGRVDEYEQYRERYPPKIIEILTAKCELQREHLVADVGAGTGMLAELFLENGNSVVALEPNNEMRGACERLATVWPGFMVKKATAEDTGLDDVSVDFVSVGRAWHWFDRDKALKEFRRILRPGGWVVLVSNRRNQNGSVRAEAFENILMELGRDYRETHKETRRMSEITPLFPGGVTIREDLYGEQMLTLEGFLGQVQSFSVAPRPGDETYSKMQVALRNFFMQFQYDDELRVETVCSVMACKLTE